MSGKPRVADLYHSDFYAWTQDQAARLRALAGDNRLDVEHLADEVADLGRSERNKVQQNVVQVLTHMLKAAWSSAPEPRAHWNEEILRHQQQARDAFSASMRQHLDVGEIWQRALRLANAALREHGEAPVPVDRTAPTNLDALLDSAFDPPTEVNRLAEYLGACGGEPK
jgi:hypothetical protein